MYNGTCDVEIYSSITAHIYTPIIKYLQTQIIISRLYVGMFKCDCVYTRTLI